MKARALLLACVALSVAGCGGDGGASNPGEALSQTAQKLSDIKSGELTLRLIVDPREEGGDFGFELSGPFELAEPDKLPIAEIEYTQIADDERETVTVISTGEAAFIEVDGTAYELPPEQADRLRQAGADLGGSDSGDGLGELRIDDWIRNPESSGGEEIGGDSTDRIEAELDVVAALNDLMTLAGSFTGGREPIKGEEAQLLRESVQDARLEVLTGTDDRLLRRLRITATFDPQLPEELEELARAAGAAVEFDLQVADPNTAVEVEAPEDPRPYSDLSNQ